MIIPVRNAADLLDACLATVVPQARDVDGRVLVVDDASSDSSAAIAERHGASVVRLQRRLGPYLARNEGWRAAETEAVVFTDVRCRARPGWLAALVPALDDGEFVVAGGDIVVLPGSTAAQRWAFQHQHLRAERWTNSYFLPFVPAGNMVVGRGTLEALGGFRPLKSGGDVDLSWRAQLSGLGAVRSVAGAEMDWVPRASLRDTLAQWRKYGRAVALLYAGYSEQGCVPPPICNPFSQAYGEAKEFASGAARRDGRDLVVDLVDRLHRVTYGWAYWRTSKALSRQRGPVLGSS